MSWRLVQQQALTTAQFHRQKQPRTKASTRPRSIPAPALPPHPRRRLPMVHTRPGYSPESIYAADNADALSAKQSRSKTRKTPRDDTAWTTSATKEVQQMRPLPKIVGRTRARGSACWAMLRMRPLARQRALQCRGQIAPSQAPNRNFPATGSSAAQTNASARPRGRPYASSMGKNASRRRMGAAAIENGRLGFWGGSGGAGRP